MIFKNGFLSNDLPVIGDYKLTKDQRGKNILEVRPTEEPRTPFLIESLYYPVT